MSCLTILLILSVARLLQKKQTLPMRKQTARYWFGDLEFLYRFREWYDGENEY